MIRSMTGFGRGISEDQTGKVTVEIKSVNHRYLELSCKMPRIMNAFEARFRDEIRKNCSRGKIDLFVTYERNAGALNHLTLNREVAEMYVDNIQKLGEMFELPNRLSANELAKYPDVLTVEEEDPDEEHLWRLVHEALQAAIIQFVANREAEGQRLADDLIDKVKTLDSYVDELKRRSPEIIAEYTARLKEKFRLFLEDGSLDDSRIAAEVTVYADKICIDEEMVRLHSHVTEALHTITNGENVGRKMDFLAQEMNRESNTILSKSTEVTIANLGIEMKTLVEKIREQIQNVE